MNLQENIRRILKEEVNKKYPKPTPKLDSLVYNWLNEYFSESQIYKIESWKYFSFSFEFCKNGKNIADLMVRFDHRSSKDKRPTSERSVDEVELIVYSEMINELLTDIPIRRTYLIYLIEEWFEDTYLNKVQQMLERNDLSLDGIYVSTNEGGVCVPPPTKPEGITTQDMMDYIKKNTLFSYEDMQKYEEDESGWIEDMYLSILRNEEQKG